MASRSSAAYNIEIKDMGDYTHFIDEWGIDWRSPKQGGLYYDLYRSPLRDAQGIEDVRGYPWPDPVEPSRFKGLARAAEHAAVDEGRAVVLGGLCAGIMEIAAWVRGFDNYYADFALNQEMLGYLMDVVLEMKIAYWEKALAEAGPFVDVVVEADDFAGQSSMLISPASYRKIAKPRHKKLFDFIHQRTRAKVFFHSCGAVRPVIPDLIEVGVDILNPVQVSAKGMDTAELKKEFGDEIAFWGGGVDTQRILGSGTTEQVKDEVRRRIEDLAPGGGFIFASVHNIQPNVPPANIMAMWEAMREYGVYPRFHNEFHLPYGVRFGFDPSRMEKKDDVGAKNE